MNIPQNWEGAGAGLDNFDGLVWFRNKEGLPAVPFRTDITE